ncbi:C-4 sterol methyl oxidase, partial [Basidiobolus ranarum]
MSFNGTAMDMEYQPSMLESWWLSLFEGRNHAFVLAAITFITHQLFYYGRYVPFWIAEYIPAMDKYKIQDNKEVTSAQRWNCLKVVLIQNHFI